MSCKEDIVDVRVCRWKGGMQWVYSITYDEGLRALYDYTVPIHRRYGVPGHVSLVARDVGKPRNVPGSSFDKMMILSRSEIDELCAEGWGVSSHSMTHSSFSDSNARREIVESRQLLEDVLERPVTMFIVPGDNSNYPLSRQYASEAGYLSLLTLWDDVNTPETDMLRLHRTPLVEEHFAPFFCAFDPYCRLHQARDLGGWVIDYTHIARPPEEIASRQKEVTPDSLARRFEKVLAVGEGRVWAAEPTEVVDYILTCGVCRAEQTEEGWLLRCRGLPAGVQRSELTLEVRLIGGSRILLDVQIADAGDVAVGSLLGRFRREAD